MNRQQAIAAFLKSHPNQEFTSAQLERELEISLNHNVTGVAPKVKALLPGVTYSLNRWKYVVAAADIKWPVVRHGQGGTCTGKLVISLRGPKGSGKSMLAAILKPLLPLLPLEEFEVREELD